MGQRAQVQGSRGHRRDVNARDVNPRNEAAEERDLQDRNRAADPHHRAEDARRDAEARWLAALDKRHGWS